MPDMKEIAMMYLGFLLVINGVFTAVDSLNMFPEGADFLGSEERGMVRGMLSGYSDVNAAVEGTTSYTSVGFTGDLLGDAQLVIGYFLNAIVVLLEWLFLFLGGWGLIVIRIFDGFGLAPFGVIFFAIFGLLQLMAVIYLAIEFRRVVKL